MSDGVKSLDLKLSSKSVVLDNKAKTAQCIVAALNAKGIPIKVRDGAVDLGIGVAAAKQRTSATMYKRIGKAKKRAERVHGLTRRNREAAKLALTGVAPQQTYGHQACDGRGTAEKHQGVHEPGKNEGMHGDHNPVAFW